MEQFRLKRILSKYEYFIDEFNENKYLFESYSNAFNKEFKLKKDEPENIETGENIENIETGETGETGETDETGETGETDEIDEIDETDETGKTDETGEKDEPVKNIFLKNIYHKLSLVTHPDKGGSQEIFKTVNDHYTNSNTLGLISMAHKYNIPTLEFLSSYTEDDFDKDITLISEKSARIKSSLAWVWQSADLAKRQELQNRFGFKHL